jgi:glycosyltransferase involved in cell wall biosynthesis
MWGLGKAMDRVGAELFHGTDFSVPYSRSVPSVMTLHDLSPWLDPGWQPDAGRVRRRAPKLLRHGFVTAVITPTEAIRSEAITRFSLDPSTVFAVPHAASPLFRPMPAEAGEKYFIFVGTLEPRKNIARIIDAWRVVTPRVSLKIVGRARRDFPALAPEPGLELLGELPDNALPGLYSNALAAIYPSLYEGFGLPVLEAMQCGALVVTSNDPAIVEVAGHDNALHFDATDTHALATTLQAVAADPARFVSLRQRARERASQFTWRRSAERTRDVYLHALAQRHV